MKTVIIEYATISPAILASRIEKSFRCSAVWRDIDEDYFELSICDCSDLVGLEGVLAQYV